MTRLRKTITAVVLLVIVVGIAAFWLGNRGKTPLTVLVLDHPVQHAAEQFISGMGSINGSSVKWSRAIATDAAHQAVALEAATGNKHLDVLILNPIDLQLVRPHLLTLKNSGVSVIVISHEKIDDFHHWHTDDRRSGQTAGDALAQRLRGRGTVYFSASTAEDLRSENRYRGVYEQLTMYPGLRALSVDYHKNRLDQATTQILSALETYPNLSALVATNATSDQAIRQVLRDTGMAGVIEVICWGLDEEHLEDMSGGTIGLIAGTDWFNLGQKTMSELITHHQQGSPIPQYLTAKATTITSAAFHRQEPLR